MVVDRAKAYVEAVAKCREAWAMLQAEVAYGHPEHLDELNRERSPEETLEMLGELRGKVDPPEGP